ncbi:hypothetical protein D5086_018189 [Populus alba]|uniref:Uncharacterized protein n=1 Tax=Populus alba TaxID=43335 RepID=A0ACC4BPC6_POPAL
MTSSAKFLSSSSLKPPSSLEQELPTILLDEDGILVSFSFIECLWLCTSKDIPTSLWFLLLYHHTLIFLSAYHPAAPFPDRKSHSVQQLDC